MNDREKDANKVAAGVARAKALSPEQRAAIAKKAAHARWGDDVPQATHDGKFSIGGRELLAAVLPNGKRLLSQGTFLQAVGRSRTPKAGTGALTTVDGLPFFLQADQLKPFLSEELRLSTTPIFFRLKSGKRAVGYDAELLPMVCEVYLRLRDHSLKHARKVPHQYAHIIEACDMLMRGLAHVGIIALVDEATGFQEDRARDALIKILEAFIAKDLRKWTKTFPSEFYREIFRLRKLKYPPDKNPPQYIGRLTNNIVYERLAPGVLDELRHKNPVVLGRRRHRHHQWLTEDVGHPKLKEHLAAVTALMRAFDSWDGFIKALDRSIPRFGDSYSLPMEIP